MEWGQGRLHTFPGVPPSTVNLYYDYRMAKYSCGVCGNKSKRNIESTFYYCKTCSFKVCEECLVHRPEWLQHKCPPSSQVP